jgi:hypothetical protein
MIWELPDQVKFFGPDSGLETKLAFNIPRLRWEIRDILLSCDSA